ncbi:hypothetical protein GGR50DRAFT_688879 [Xylaria sp. CBS 124048]|nr:hypothetical protein GGR50DRAFT_688879 [Xylaria sp. CBS 124048]
MSGRSAYVRKKKVTEPKTATVEKGPPSNNLGWSTISSRDPGNDDSVYDYQTPPGTVRGRYPKFSDRTLGSDDGHYRPEIEDHGRDNGSSRYGGSDNGIRDGGFASPSQMADHAYTRARRSTPKTPGDVSGIERSGFRSALDKKSDDIRRGLTKAFTLGLKKKASINADRKPSTMTLRAHYCESDEFDAMKSTPSFPTHGSSGGMCDSSGFYQTVSSPMHNVATKPRPPSQPFAATPIKRWIGTGRPIQRWNKLRKDPELWNPNGDVLVYLGPREQSQLLNPSFRLSSHIIEATGSKFLLSLLREGSTENDYDDINDMDMPPSPMGTRGHSSYAQLQQHTNRGTPPISEDDIQGDIDGQISYRLFFAIPPNLTKAEAHCHAITTRNVFALLCNASLVGTSLFQALQDLRDRLDDYMGQTEADSATTILHYISTRGIDDVRNDPETAVSLLAWSEIPEVRWEEGWREAFLHCVGMYSRLENCADYRHLTPITRALLERACLETQLRVQVAEARLRSFTYADIWPGTAGRATNSSEKAAADRFQRFLVNYYTRICGTWPPPIESGARTMEGEIWLTRRVTHMLQKDFGALYDYLVNRDIVWDESEMRSSRKWMMVSESGNKSFDADTEDLPLTDILIEFDNRMRYPHIPHPYPLVPEPIHPVQPMTPTGTRGKSRRDKTSRSNPDDRTLERRIQLAYTEATNIYNLGCEFERSDLIENFVRFEKSDQIGAVDPSRARRGRWVLIYIILQTLASISVDSPNVRYKDGVSYHLSARVKGATKTPPWKGAISQTTEASHELSHCWVAGRRNSGDDAESEDSVTSSGGATDPAVHMMRARLQHFPRPPRSLASRSSHAGGGNWQQASSGRSVRSSGTATPTMWGGSSAMSLSNFSDDMTLTSNNARMLSIPHPQFQATYSQKILPSLPPRSPRRNGGGRSDGNNSVTMTRKMSGSRPTSRNNGGGSLDVARFNNTAEKCESPRSPTQQPWAMYKAAPWGSLPRESAMGPGRSLELTSRAQKPQPERVGGDWKAWSSVMTSPVVRLT